MLTRIGKSKQAKVEGTEDRLQNLPDEILTHILSFLSTKESVRTSILSARWNSVWASVPTLDLTMIDFCSKENDFFVDQGGLFDFLNRVLTSGIVHSLQKVDIKASYPYYSSQDVQPRVCAAIEESVVGLWYESDGVSVNRPYEFPQSLFCCKKLVVLKLCVKMVLNFPMASICFPNLKVLALVSIIYKDDYSAQNLFSSCPVLEDLVIVRETNDNLGTLNVTSGSLKNLVIEVTKYWGEFSVHVQKTLIDASALESLHIDDDATDEYNVVKDFSSITNAKLALENNEMCLFELLKKISNVKFLSLSYNETLSAANSFNLPTFENLTCLEVIHDGTFNSYFLELQLLLEFLKRSPVLEVLFFEGWLSWPEEFGTSLWDVPSCLLSHLKTIIIRTDMEESVQLISYFLKNAKVLEKMTIDCLGDEDVKLMLNEELSMSLRGSIACQVEIIRRSQGLSLFPFWCSKIR